MEGRRVSRRAPKRNPLYVLFLCLVAAVFILLIVTIVLGAKLGAANKQLTSAQQQVEELQEKVSAAQKEQKEEASKENLPSAGAPVVTPEKSEENKTSSGSPSGSQSSQTSQKKVTVGWLDLTGHNEVAVLPDSVFNEYHTYYTTDGVNLRAGPGTSHNRITLVEKAAKVKAAAKDGEWTFVSVGNKFGWINSNYLSTTQPTAASAGAGSTAEATSGSLKTQ